MSRTTRYALGLSAAIVLLCMRQGVDAQTVATVRVTRPAVVMEQPRGDSIRVATLAPGEVLEVIGRRDRWLLVNARADAGRRPAWEQGWIHESSLEVASGTLPATGAAGERPSRPPAPGRLRIRAFGQAGGTVFAAQDSFDTILGSSFGTVAGAGGQVVLPNDVFVQVSVERFRETGTRAVVSGEHIFTVDTPAVIAVTPVVATAGYRSPAYGRFAPYVGAGLGWHVLTEESPNSGERTRQGTVGYHVLGGSEFVVGRLLAIAAEAQWATVPDALGATGVSAVFGEQDLGGLTFRLKLIIGY